ncbi:MAG: corrinoid protein [Deltaproteobacteria bacterium]|nr:corrinoid protein [Deltaproteobacteria bacterium]
MGSPERTEQLLSQIHDAIVAFDEEASARLCRSLLDEGIEPYYGVTKGLAPGMDTVGKLYEKREYFIPQLLLCTDAFNAGMEILKPHIKLDLEGGSAGKVILGVVEGDIHDIGKNLVKTMFEVAGWETHDLGRDVKLDRFPEEQQKVQADIVAVSALMTTSMLAIPKLIEMLRGQGGAVRIMVGGAPLSPDIARQYGADGYAPDAVSAVKEAGRLLKSRPTTERS